MQLLALKPDYESLLSLCCNRLPFALHEWHLAWCDSFLQTGSRINTQLMIFVVRNRAGQCVALIPMILMQRAIGPLKVRTLSLLGADPAITEIRTSLIQPGFEAQVAWATLREVAAMREIHWIHWGNISGKFAETLAVGAELSWQDPLLDYVLDLPVSWEALRGSLKRNVRQSIRHCYNSLKRKGIEFDFRVAAAPADVPPALEIFFSLHAMRAEVTGTVSHPNHFEREVPRNFLRSICKELSARSMVRVFQLVIAGQVVATRIGFVIHDSLYLYYSGFDPRWAPYGVMTTTLTEAIKYAIGEGITSVNLSPGKDVSKTRWGPRELGLDQAVQVGASVYSKFAWKSFQLASHARNNSSIATRLLQFASRDWD
jgi:CelD/BcsL family acetyltransferase involved in cellulose biosynthesis